MDRKIMKTQLIHIWNEHRYVSVATIILLVIAIIL
jgi:hypothetical protein